MFEIASGWQWAKSKSNNILFDLLKWSAPFNYANIAIYRDCKMYFRLFWSLGDGIRDWKQHRQPENHGGKAQVSECTHEGQWEQEKGGEVDRDGGGLSNTLQIKVKDMFYSWWRQRQQWRHQGQGCLERASSFPMRKCCAVSARPVDTPTNCNRYCKNVPYMYP